MIVFVNPRSGAGAGISRWQKIEPRMRERFGELRVILLDAPDAVSRGLEDACHTGDHRIVAAGGDGTANAVVHALLSPPSGRAAQCVLGAIGLGSSNDFHKPFNGNAAIDGIPARLDFDNATWCDAGRITFADGGSTSVRHFFLNASAGITADGNCRFNRPGPVLGALKKLNTRAAIFYAAITALAGYRNTPVSITIQDRHPVTLELTNLGILKSPFFSGDLHYDVACNYSNGRFAVIACEQMNIPARIRLFRSLLRGTTEGLTGVRSWSTPELRMESDVPIPLEFDGETITTSSVRFTAVPHALRVCP
jgi:diacylglycerol kinase (ATP)